MSDHGFNNCSSASNDVSTVNIDCTTATDITGTVKINFSSHFYATVSKLEINRK